MKEMVSCVCTVPTLWRLEVGTNEFADAARRAMAAIRYLMLTDRYFRYCRDGVGSIV